MTDIRLRDPASGREWRQRLGDSLTDVRYPRQTWLSPLERRQTFFHIVPEEPVAPGSSWVVPRQALARAQLQMTGGRESGCAVVDYSLENVDLNRWRMQPPPGR
jgi:hypothetical protein